MFLHINMVMNVGKTNSQGITRDHKGILFASYDTCLITTIHFAQILKVYDYFQIFENNETH